jgi:hypothetical protein
MKVLFLTDFYKVVNRYRLEFYGQLYPRDVVIDRLSYTNSGSIMKCLKEIVSICDSAGNFFGSIFSQKLFSGIKNNSSVKQTILIKYAVIQTFFC